MHDTRPVDGAPTPPNADYEDRDVRVMGVVFAGIALLILVVVVFAGMAMALNYFSQDRPASTAGQLNPARDEPIANLGPEYRPQLPPQPRLQVNEPGDLARIYAEWDRELRSPAGRGANGAYHIPIDAAIRAVAQPGRLPARRAQDTGRGAISDWDLETADSSGGSYGNPDPNLEEGR